MPGTPTLPAIPDIVEAAPGTAIIVLTMQTDPAFAREAMRVGARGYVAKAAAGDELVEAIRTVTGGGTYINPALGARLAAAPPSPLEVLTPREVEVLESIARGHTNPEIAEQLGLSVRTVETHRANIQQKLDLSTRAELTNYAIENALLER